MSIWQYACLSKDEAGLLGVLRCPFCAGSLSDLDSHEETTEPAIAGGYARRETIMVSVCPVCGWWKAKKHRATYPTGVRVVMHGFDSTWGAVGSLRQLDLSDISVPLEEVRSYLTAKYEARYTVHPRLFEETVASVFRTLGYRARVTDYSGDEGIDIILCDGLVEIGVQVKRYKHSIKVEQIRSLVGALVLGGLTKGIFVTTSSFQKGVEKARDRYHRVGYAIKLLDAPRFLAALRIAQRPMYLSFADFSGAHCLDEMGLIEGRKAY